MPDLKDRLIAMIRADGPMSVSAYMNTCLHDPQHGYYATNPGLGTDFITAPEISQVFGELLGLWSVHEWQAMGAPSPVTLAEIGPGRGTLISDALRAAGQVPGFTQAVDLNLIEPSPILQTPLKQRLADHTPTFPLQIEDLPDQPLILLANEWLDCLPARQFVKTGEVWNERVIGLGPDDRLAFGIAADRAPDDAALMDAKSDAIEVQAGLETLVLTLKHLFAARPGRALLIDYGPAAATPGDTLRAYKDGQQIDPLSLPGESDLTVDVDFARLRRLTEANGLTVHGSVPQGQFLLALGAEARLNSLANAHRSRADALYQGVRKLVDPAEMGTRFNVICLSSDGLPPPAGF